MLKQIEGDDPDEITISQIASLARVLRMAYYRNFSCRRNIVRYYIGSVLRADMNKLINSSCDFWSREYGTKFFELMRQHRELILLLERFGYSSVLLECSNEANVEYAGDMPQGSIDCFSLYFAAGATFNACMIWLHEGCKESPEEMSECFGRFCSLIAADEACPSR